MFPQNIDYEAALICSYPARTESSEPAWQWALEQSRNHPGQLAVVAPLKARYRDDPILKKLPNRWIRATWKTLEQAARATVVVALWPNSATLEKLDRLPRLQALVVLPWLEDDVAAWRDARRAMDLLTSVRAEPQPLDSRVVEAALSALTIRVNLATGLTHPDDRAAAIGALQLLHSGGYPLDTKGIRVWAMSHGWRADAARELADYAAGVADGRTYRTRGSSGWSPESLNWWRLTADPEIASRNQKRVEAFWRRLADNGVVGLEDVAERNGVSEDTVRGWSGSRIIVTSHEDREIVPAFLLDANASPKPAFEPLVSELSSFLSPRESWAWLGAPASLLSGDTPAEIAETEPQRALRAARDYRAQLDD